MLHVNLLTPALTTVRHSATEFGRHGVRLLVSEINGAAAPEKPVRIPVELIVRDSVAAPRPRRMPSSRRAAEAGTSRTLHRKVKATAG
jgi:hypothetical protein